MNLVNNIKRLRKDKGLSQAQLAEKVGCHLSHITRIETGKYVPGLETIAKIADILEVSIDYLVNSTREIREENPFEDQTFLEQLRLLNTLDEEERFVVNKVIDAILMKKRMLRLLQEERSPRNL